MRIVAVLFTFVSLTIAGCDQQRLTDAEFWAIFNELPPESFAISHEMVDEPTKSWAIKIADERAQEVLAEANTHPDHVAGSEHFSLDQFARRVIRVRQPEMQMNLLVSYALHSPGAFRGHPRHFGVFVCEEDGSTRVSSGR